MVANRVCACGRSWTGFDMHTSTFSAEKLLAQVWKCSQHWASLDGGLGSSLHYA